MITAIAMIVAIATKKLSYPYPYKFPYDRYDRDPERTWNKQRRTAFWYIFHRNDRHNLWRVVSI